ncbi:16S rRNA (guanine(966)-N(2))-methyltransferase RsmD [Candidatus Tachikawaea gelatinosa]|uniref:Ribosomal RNA small subunit methyltransferase D n=1 Tax=Candidatus Tachikawaea gelatinosa TaxID=1410383 RepID=A0A090AJ63_9ENTR|nr:16S rRNA (guanine(966)-N(2))-methyltransferase RsmD [Candidatus Tachikawaea gelatinosa]BAP58478.1 methyltransferase [Candidatus Tachikawaea gelatinosa]
MKKNINTKKKFGKIRIIGGKWKNKKISVINNQELRPTSNRMRETLFNWLMPYIDKAFCLDCYAGTGALGLEAISRNAQHVTFLELQEKIFKILIENIKEIKAEKYIIANKTDTIYWLSNKSNYRYDIIFIDPPFLKNLLKKTIDFLEKNHWLSDKAIIYIESKKEKINEYNFNIPKNWLLQHKKSMGNVTCFLYEKI